MIVSSDVESPHFTQRRYRVLLDGEEQKNVVYADDEEGVIVLVDMEAPLDDEITVSERRGRVDIILCS